MKNTKKSADLVSKMLEACAQKMLVASSNSTGSWWNDQPKAPSSLRKFRKF